MAIQFSVTVRNARADAIETITGTSAILKIYGGTIPASCSAAITGTVLATLNLPADWMTAAASGAKAIAGGPWQDTSADAAGTATHYRIFASDGTTCHIQGSVSMSGGGGDMILDNTNIALGQPVSITGYSFTEQNA